MFPYGKRLGILRTQAKDECAPMRQEPAKGMLRDVAKQRVGTQQGALRLGADAEQLEGRHATKRCKTNLQGIALRPRGRPIEQD